MTPERRISPVRCWRGQGERYRLKAKSTTSLNPGQIVIFEGRVFCLDPTERLSLLEPKEKKKVLLEQGEIKL